MLLLPDGESTIKGPPEKLPLKLPRKVKKIIIHHLTNLGQVINVALVSEAESSPGKDFA